jgi:DNA-binding response OmpR family regulator
MRDRQPGDRLRVVIAGNVYAKRALVRRFLEDDGFDVVAETFTASELLALPDLDRADAVVVDADLVNGATDALRSAAPDAAIVVFTTGATDARARPPGAHAYLEKGVGLASLTALLHALLSEPSTSLPAFDWPEPPRGPRSERRVLAGLAGVAAAIVLTAVAALALFGGPAPIPTPAPAPPQASPSPGTTTTAPSEIELAMGDLRELEQAIANDRTIEARLVLDRLEREMRAAEEAGFSLATLETKASQLLQPVLGGVAPTLLDELQSLFGPYLDFTTVTSGSHEGGTGLIGDVTSGTTTSETTTGGVTTSGDVGGVDTTAGGGGETTGGGTTGGGGGGGETTGGGTTGGGGGDTTGDGDTNGDVGAGGGDDDGATPGGTPPAGSTAHGNGHHYGWTNKPPAGGWHGTKPKPEADAGLEPDAIASEEPDHSK